MNVRLSGIELKYSYKHVLKGVDVKFDAGKIHALLGENGAGKSSLMNILTGFIKADSGQIFLEEKEVCFNKPADSLKQGIACVYQRPYLSDSLTVLENLKVGLKGFKKNDISEAELPEGISLQTKASELSGDQRFFVAFCASLLRKPKVLILDEPTALLDSEQSKKLFKKLRSLAEENVNVIVITHKGEDLKYCDDVIYLAEGKVEAVYETAGDDSLLLEESFRKKNERLDAGKCFELRKSGKTAIIPSDRTYLASNPELTITQLVCSTFTESANPKMRKSHTEEIIAKAGINIRPEEKACNLSGGMLQRLILERELYSEPETVYLEDPFQGLDQLSCRKLSDRLSECEKNGIKVVYL